MGLIRIYQGKSKPAKRKPGWQKAAQEYAEWQSKIASMSSGMNVPKSIKSVKRSQPKPDVVRNVTEGISLPAKYVIGSGTKEVPRPEITYRDNPEMLERELAARAVRHNAAPMYNKGGDGYVSEEMLQELLSTNKRRS